jgi:hypothetical protein
MHTERVALKSPKPLSCGEFYNSILFVAEDSNDYRLGKVFYEAVS